MNTRPAHTVVLGLGNILHSDDGVGPLAVERLKQDRRVAAEATLIDGGTLGLELLGDVWGASRLLVLDAVDVGHQPGTLIRMADKDLDALPGRASVHQLGVADLLVALRVLAGRVPVVVLLGVQPATTEWGTTLSAPVAAALDSLVEAAVDELSDKEGPEVCRQGAVSTLVPAACVRRG